MKKTTKSTQERRQEVLKMVQKMGVETSDLYEGNVFAIKQKDGNTKIAAIYVTSAAPTTQHGGEHVPCFPYKKADWYFFDILAWKMPGAIQRSICCLSRDAVKARLKEQASWAPKGKPYYILADEQFCLDNMPINHVNELKGNDKKKAAEILKKKKQEVLDVLHKIGVKVGGTYRNNRFTIEQDDGTVIDASIHITSRKAVVYDGIEYIHFKPLQDADWYFFYLLDWDYNDFPCRPLCCLSRKELSARFSDQMDIPYVQDASGLFIDRTFCYSHLIINAKNKLKGIVPKEVDKTYCSPSSSAPNLPLKKDAGPNRVLALLREMGIDYHSVRHYDTEAILQLSQKDGSTKRAYIYESEEEKYGQEGHAYYVFRTINSYVDWHLLYMVDTEKVVCLTTKEIKQMIEDQQDGSSPYFASIYRGMLCIDHEDIAYNAINQRQKALRGETKETNDPNVKTLEGLVYKEEAYFEKAEEQEVIIPKGQAKAEALAYVNELMDEGYSVMCQRKRREYHVTVMGESGLCRFYPYNLGCSGIPYVKQTSKKEREQ